MTRAQITTLDRLLLYRLRCITHDQCEECGKTVKLFQSQTSHGDSRRFLGIRWDRLNVLHLCAACHWTYSDHPSRAEDFLRKHLGGAGYEELKRRSFMLIKTSRLDYGKIRAYIANLELGHYPDVSPLPLWEL